MSSLSVYHQSSPDLPNKVLTHLEDIASTLAAVGVHFTRWQSAATLSRDADSDALIAAYRPQIEQLMAERGYAGVEVLRVDDGQPQPGDLAAQEGDEHRHADDEVRFFAAGRGLFNLHIDDYVYAVQCEKSDLLLIPAGVHHWFDMGEHPYCVAIRLFNSRAGLAVEPSGGDIASRFPRLDD